MSGFWESELNTKDGTNELFPIPQTEIDLSQGKLRQNNGY